jgi:uncharacterized protein
VLAKFLSVKVKTRARADMVQEMVDGSLLISVKAAPLDGEANTEVLRLLATYLHLPHSALEIKVGITSSSKLIRITQ